LLRQLRDNKDRDIEACRKEDRIGRQLKDSIGRDLETGRQSRHNCRDI
jgi:hypothetical protein